MGIGKEGEEEGSEHPVEANTRQCACLQPTVKPSGHDPGMEARKTKPRPPSAWAVAHPSEARMPRKKPQTRCHKALPA